MASKQYKVLFLSSWYPNRHAPTLGIFIQRHAQAVALHNSTATLYVCSDATLKSNYEITESTEKGVYTVIVYYKKVSSPLPLWSHWLKWSRYKKAFTMGYAKILGSFGKPDVVHGNILFPMGIQALQLKKKFSIPYIVTENWTGYLPSDGNYRGMFRKMMTKRIANSAACLTPVSHDLQEAMQGHGFCAPYEIVPNVVDVNLFHLATNRPANAKTRIIHVSALDDAQKNISGMLRVIKKVADKRKDFELLIVGDGANRAELEQYAATLNLMNGTVIFTGMKLREELATLLRNADFFLLFSNYENLPCVVIEALASGIPVIATRIGGTPEHISDKLGILVEPKDEVALEAAIHKMLDTHKGFDANYLRQYATEHFSFEKVGKQFHDIYERVIDGK